MEDVKLMGRYSSLMTLFGQAFARAHMHGGMAGGSRSAAGFTGATVAKWSWLIIANKLH